MFEEVKERVENTLKERVLSYKIIQTGYVNKVYILKSSNKLYILKVYNTHLPKSKIEASIQVQKYLSREQLSPKIIHVICDKQPICAIHEYIGNDYTQINAEHFQYIGELLGKIHKVLLEFSCRKIETYKPYNEL